MQAELYKWPRTNFRGLCASTGSHNKRPGIAVDISSLLCICSELTWNPEAASRVIPASDKVMRPRQMEHEMQHPGQMRMFFSNLLRSELALYHTQETLVDVEHIMSPIAGPREKERLAKLKEANIVVPMETLDSPWDGTSTKILSLSPELFPFLISSESNESANGLVDIELGDIQLIESETLRESAVQEEHPSVTKEESTSEDISTASDDPSRLKRNGNSPTIPDIVVLIGNCNSQEFAESVPERRQKRRRIVGATACLSVTPKQAECIGRKRAERREKRRKENEKMVLQLKSNLTDLVTSKRRIPNFCQILQKRRRSPIDTSGVYKPQFNATSFF
eukprot:Gregarina_sp_Poly_1__6309@NODE_3357_length_1154_cov_113_957682_g1139_i2_p1_GENE_NODE_3357_length_1154_cov_113_957682_g1139_i2NODE_3357_length_1154_cov_113_957682_g1139_i2_p1_ORF_typecomplete_len344_score53_62DUF1308/PF07000_11/5_6e09Chisel/PF15355_6/3_5Chisel/PF15355_6/1_2e03Chisel/PF15355_6/3_2e03Chisel/PF15355_6/6e03_NODE_3357_length_1154_cov_113_957682_g1139_i2251032